MGLALFLIPSMALRAQDAESDPPQQPHPDMRAARLSFVTGDVQLSQGNQIIADPALANTPLFEGTVVSTREDGQAELQFDDGSIARLSPNSSLQISVLRQDGGAGNTEVLLTTGLGYFEIAANASNQMVTRFGESTVKASGWSNLGDGNGKGQTGPLFRSGFKLKHPYPVFNNPVKACRCWFDLGAQRAYAKQQERCRSNRSRITGAVPGIIPL